MKNCVLTISVSNIYEKIAKLTHPTLKAYADKIGADFVCIDKSVTSTPHWEKFNQIFNLLNKYERIIYLDTDIIIRSDCPDLFELVPKEKLGLFNEMPFTSQRNLSLIDSCKDYGILLKKWNGHYYNTGVMVISRQHKYIYKKPIREAFSFYEQGYFNANLAKILESDGNELAIFELSYKFNRMTCMDQFTGEERFASYIIHYAGYPNLQYVLNLIEKDKKKWDDDYPDFAYQQHILIDVQGGLGDQICAEPVIRFLKDRVYQSADITIITHWPSIFIHLNLPTFLHGEFIPKNDIPYYHIVSLPGPETIVWRYLSNLLCHSIDFISAALLRRILPNSDKTIKLICSKEGVDDVKNILKGIDLTKLVLIHPGRHWPSKTFPTSWWQKIIEELMIEGEQVCIIGKDEETRGTIELKISEKVIDTRNLLSFDSLIYLISQAKVVISNDSAPIYVGGAFDNWIILIPTCKHPDHILPFRNGTQSYKTKALYKKLMCYDYNSKPTALSGALADYVPSNWNNYLPDTKEVIEAIKECK